MTDLASRAQAREEVALLLSRFSRIGHCGQCLVIEPNEIAGILLDPNRFDRLNALLGYVKADGGHWLVRRDEITYPNVFVDEAAARLWARDFTDRGAGCVFVRRCTADVEVVTDAEQG